MTSGASAGFAGTGDRSSRFRAPPEGPFRLVRLRLDDLGRRVRTVDVLDAERRAGRTDVCDPVWQFRVLPRLAGARLTGRSRSKSSTLK